MPYVEALRVGEDFEVQGIIGSDPGNFFAYLDESKPGCSTFGNSEEHGYYYGTTPDGKVYRWYWLNDADLPANLTAREE